MEESGRQGIERRTISRYEQACGWGVQDWTDHVDGCRKGERNPQAFEIPQHVWSPWCFHPETDVDVCVLAFGICANSLTLRDGESLDYGCFPTIIAPNTDTTPDIGLIEDVLFVGYPNGMFDKANNLPVARRGITATPATVDYGGRPVFLIDASVFPGSSGSPVFLYNVGGWRSTTAFVAGDRILFLARISHQVTAADADLTAFAALNAARDRAPPPHPAGSR